MITYWTKNILSFNLSLYTTKKIEKYIQSIYPQTYPVLFPSARSIMYFMCLYKGFSRHQFVFLPPYSSHCVLSAIARRATPTVNPSHAIASFCYYQWGLKFDFSVHQNIIKDRADSFITPQYSFFEDHCEFEFISCPKVLNTSRGAILFCKNKIDAENIKELIRNQPNIPTTMYLIKKLKKYVPFFETIYSSLEETATRLSIFDIFEISSAFKNFSKILKIRFDNFYLVSNHFKGNYFENGILPTAVPLPSTEINIQVLKDHGVSTEQRMILVDSLNYKFEKVLPLPVHQDVSISKLKSILSKIELIT